MQFEIYGANNLNFVEFNLTGDHDTLQRCDKDSLYMDTELFDLFSDSFEKGNNLYEYFGPTKYNARNIVVLLNSLKMDFSAIENINLLEAFEHLLETKFSGSGFLAELDKTEPNWRSNWEQYKTKLLGVSQQLIDVVNRCINEERILWVIGY
jgi:hypothetical protein